MWLTRRRELVGRIFYVNDLNKMKVFNLHQTYVSCSEITTVVLFHTYDTSKYQIGNLFGPPP